MPGRLLQVQRSVEQLFGKASGPQAHRGRHGNLHVGPPRQGHIRVALSQFEKGGCGLQGGGRQAMGGIPGPDPQGGQHLVVAAATGVDLLSGLPQTFYQRVLDGRVPVFILRTNGKLIPAYLAQDLAQSLFELLQLVRGEDIN